jgi:hypothetical protein
VRTKKFYTNISFRIPAWYLCCHCYHCLAELLYKNFLILLLILTRRILWPWTMSWNTTTSKAWTLGFRLKLNVPYRYSFRRNTLQWQVSFTLSFLISMLPNHKVPTVFSKGPSSGQIRSAWERYHTNFIPYISFLSYMYSTFGLYYMLFSIPLCLRMLGLNPVLLRVRVDIFVAI